MSVNLVKKVDGNVRVRCALVSVSDKSGLDMLIPELLRINPDMTILSTGGTFNAINGILGENHSANVVEVAKYTGQPETQGGLVKTLDFRIYLGLLTETYNSAHQADLQRTGAIPIDLVVVNLYPFQRTVTNRDVILEMARANIDIGGPCMIRAGAKNFHRVTVVTDPADYSRLLDLLENNNGCSTLYSRLVFAQRAFAHTEEYERAIFEFLRAINPETELNCYEIL